MIDGKVDAEIEPRCFGRNKDESLPEFQPTALSLFQINWSSRTLRPGASYKCFPLEHVCQPFFTYLFNLTIT